MGETGMFERNEEGGKKWDRERILSEIAKIRYI